MYATFIHPITGENRQVKIGKSWTLFLFGTFLGIPFFIRKMYSWGIFMCTLYLLYIITIIATFTTGDETYGIFNSIIYLIFLGFAGYFLVYGNKMTAKYYLQQGFRIKSDNELISKQVKITWNFPDDVFIKSE